MMLPILISVSLAPGSYFFWASAGLAESARPARSASAAERAFPTMCILPVGGAGRHDIDQQDEHDTVDGAGQALGDLLGQVRHEQDEGRARERARDGADAADHKAHQEGDGEEE